MYSTIVAVNTDKTLTACAVNRGSGKWAVQLTLEKDGKTLAEIQVAPDDLLITAEACKKIIAANKA